MILRSVGFVTVDLFVGRNAVNFAYVLCLLGRAQGTPAADLERLRRLFIYASIVKTSNHVKPNYKFQNRLNEVQHLVQQEEKTDFHPSSVSCK
jgi:hypothetical protein